MMPYSIQYHNIRYQMYMMMEHLGSVMDGEATFDMLELWNWMNDVLHKEEE